MEKNSWTVIKEFYKEAFGFPEGLVELVSLIDILKMCVSGSSNKTISEFFKMDKEYIDQVIADWLWFEGWEEDLNFSPYSVYCSLEEKYSVFRIVNFERELENVASPEFIKKYRQAVYRICQYYYKYEDMIKNEWY